LDSNNKIWGCSSRWKNLTKEVVEQQIGGTKDVDLKLHNLEDESLLLSCKFSSPISLLLPLFSSPCVEAYPVIFAALSVSVSRGFSLLLEGSTQCAKVTQGWSNTLGLFPLHVGLLTRSIYSPHCPHHEEDYPTYLPLQLMRGAPSCPLSRCTLATSLAAKP